MLPVVFFSFANHSEHQLSNLKSECDQINRLMSSLASKQQIQMHLEPYATIQNISDALINYKDRLCIFHYAGHADTQELLLLDQKANSDGIAHLLKQQKSLKLVFLNGCSTYPQIRLLLKLGIPAVIATSGPVDDATASEFSATFYKGIVNNYSLKKAFDSAAAFIQTKYGHRPRIYRGLGKKIDTDTLAWGLYTNLTEKELNQSPIPPYQQKVKEKNVVHKSDLHIKGNAHLGDKSNKPSLIDPDVKNKIDESKIIVDGDFHLGDHIQGEDE